MEEVRYQDVIHDYGFGGAPKDGGATVVANEARAVTLAMTTVPGVMRGLKTGARAPARGPQHAPRVGYSSRRPARLPDTESVHAMALGPGRRCRPRAEDRQRETVVEAVDVNIVEWATAPQGPQSPR